MDLSTDLSAVAAGATASKASFSVAKKSLDTAKEEGQQLVELIDSAKEIGENANSGVDAASGRVDVYA